MIRSVLMSALLAAGLAGSATAETITVCAKGCDYTSINAAIAVASDGDVIQLAAETYYEGEVIDTDGKAITLRGVLGKASEPLSMLDGNGAHRVLICHRGEGAGTVFEGVVIQNGLASEPNPGDRGAGLFNYNSSPTLINCTFRNNSASRSGGGVVNYASKSILTDCTFTGNSATSFGGGLFDQHPVS